MKWFKLVVPASLNYSEAVRMLSMEVAEDAWTFTKREKNMIRLVIDELFMNAVRYWSDKDSSVLVEWAFEPWNVIFAIEDEWKWTQKISSEELKNIINEEKKNVNLKKTHWRWLAQITWVMSSAFEVLDWEMWGIRIEFSKKAWDKDPDKLLSRDSKPGWWTSNIKNSTILEEREFFLKWDIDMNNVYEVAGEIDSYVTSVEFPVKVLLNCKDLTFFNSIFLWYLAGWYSRIDKYWWKLVLSNISDDALEVLDLVWLASILEIEAK